MPPVDEPAFHARHCVVNIKSLFAAQEDVDQGPRSRGGGEGFRGHVPPPIFLKLKRISKEKCLVPPPLQY